MIIAKKMNPALKKTGKKQYERPYKTD